MNTGRKNIVVLGGGTGTSIVLRGLKKYPVNLTAIPAMADDGGSTGILRRELGILPPGDVRQCIIALADDRIHAERLLSYRFSVGTFAGHNAGNILLGALELEFGNLEEALSYCCSLFRIQGNIYPATFTKTSLVGHFPNKIVQGQSLLHAKNLEKLLKITLHPLPKTNPKALSALQSADAIIFAPGDWYSSIIPNLLIPGIRNVINKSTAVKIHICNLVTTKKHTDTWSVRTFRKNLEIFLRGHIDYTLYNNKIPQGKAAMPFTKRGHTFVKIDNNLDECYISAPLIDTELVPQRRADPILRNPVRHDECALAKTIMAIIENHT